MTTSTSDRSSAGPATLGVVVPTRDRAELLDGCLAALRAALGPRDRLLVVDSASRRPDVATVAARHGVEVLRAPVKGVSLARNAGWRAMDTDVVAFVDDDVRVDAGWATAVRAAFDADPSLGFLTGRVDEPGDGGRRPVALKTEDDPSEITSAVSGNVGHGANLAMRRSVLLAIGGFDERLGSGARLHAAEDYDLFDRLLAAGFTGRYDPRPAAVHVQWRGRGAMPRLEWGYGVGLGARVARLAWSDRTAAREAAAVLFWRWGVRSSLRAARRRDKLGVVLPLIRVAGGAVGVLRVRSRVGEASRDW